MSRILTFGIEQAVIWKWGNGMNSDELSELKIRARGGDPQAQFELGQHYDFDPPKRHKQANRWYLAAANQGLAEAQNYLGEAYREGDYGLQKNLRTA